MSRSVLDLGSLAWQLGRVPRQPPGAVVNDRALVTDWLPATVPGDVRADLIDNGRIPPVDTPEGITAGAWVDDYDWWYRAQLPGGYEPSQMLLLEADGVDFYSATWLDDRLLATHAGMFARQVVSLSPGLNKPGLHELAIRLSGGGVFRRSPGSFWQRGFRALAKLTQPGSDLFSERLFTTKAQFSFGWDFSPRLLTTGIWDDVRLVTARSVYAEDLWVYGEPLRPATDPIPARWHLRLRLTRWVPTTIRVEISLRPENFGQAGYQSLTRTVELCAPGDSPCTSDYDFDLEMAAARRWWPWDQGEPCLYRVTVRLFDDQGMLDEISQTAAIRSVRRTELSGDPWQFVVNDRPVFVRGANWVPADVLPGRLRDTHYAALLQRARDAGVNFLRVWGGGIREKRAFWDGCDRLGIMAWQEFPLACDFFDHYPRDAEYLALLASEAHGMVRALRGHPSLIAWCGGNEINLEREDLPLRRIREVLAEDDPTRPWIPASPVSGDVHQWDVWHGEAPWTDLAAMQAPFMSEFGLQSLPNAETVAAMFRGSPPRSLADRRWGQRKAQVSKLLHYAGPAARGALDDAIGATQRVQAVALKVGLEAARLRRSRKRSGEETVQSSDAFCGGVAFWQLNEPWPAVSWSVIDAAGRPKAAYQAICQSYQPLLVAARFPWRPYVASETFPVEFWLVNDDPHTWEGCCATAMLDGQMIWSRQDILLTPASVQRAGAWTGKLAAPPQVLELQLTRQIETLATNRYDLAVPLPPPRPWRTRLGRWLMAFLPK